MMKASALIVTVVICIGALVTFAHAQSTSDATWADTLSLYHQMEVRMMRNMTQEMVQMTDEMSQASLTAEQRKQMAERMAHMSKMMQYMSGLAARPAHTHTALQQQMEEMRRQMDAMTRNSQMAPGAK